ncbi:hypothetical protein P152DRAFT_10682 [Eremomyces bilateralis CBS 781.70]|uniref:Fungal N-terminal domain-containing protein n=1 Tax=Eremomyces bilateralis CBS 781.70 TaxID=1392243 RepID=A0A6G1GGG7_9PEZI|nr:uncharacterized protein P152DRAFT_10682 [Eremomyces bilateralis CBS 781.70]KAF1817197.1 hypothetical protein P152DRAFT_10682 [Eremomyces bilateralis CBS 781.70]
MDPASILGVTAATASLLKHLIEGSLGLQTALWEIKTIDETTGGLAGELGAFHSILIVFDSELRDQQFLSHVHRWWDPSRLEELLSNAIKTYSNLSNIVKDLGRQRSVLQTLRQYYTSRQYDKEIGHLRLRIGIYITALQIPVELGRIHSIRQSITTARTKPEAQSTRTQRDVDVLASQILGSRIV